MKTLGQVAFEAYGLKDEKKTDVEKLIWKWAEASETVKASWEAAADAVLACGWQPVADGEYKCDCSTPECTHTFEIEADGIFFTAKADGDAITVDLGGRMVCERK